MRSSSGEAPSQQVVESLRAAIRERTAQHENKLHKDVDDAKNVLALLNQLDVRRQQRRPRADNATADAATRRRPPAGPHQEPSRSVVHTLDPTAVPSEDDGSVDDDDDTRAQMVSEIATERALLLELQQTQEENDALEVFLLRHPEGGRNTGNGTQRRLEVARRAAGCTAWRHELTSLLDAVVLHAKGVVEARCDGRRQGLGLPHGCDQRQTTHRTAAQLRTLSLVTQRNREMLQGCAVLEAEVERISHGAEATLSERNGIAWGVTDVAVRPLPSTRGVSPRPVWNRLAHECRRWVEEANLVLDTCVPVVDECRQDAEQGMENQWDMIRRHLQEATEVV